MNLKDVWNWLGRDSNRRRLAFIGAGAVVVIGGGWAVFTYVNPGSEANGGPTSNTIKADRGGVAIGQVEIQDGVLSINRSIDAEEIRTLIAPYVASHDDLTTQISELSRELGVTEGAVRAFFSTLDEQQVPREKWPETLAQIAGHYLELRERLRSITVDDEQQQGQLDEALQAIDNGEYDRAEKILEALEQNNLAAMEGAEEAAASYRRQASQARASRGDVAMARINYLTAAEHFGVAASLISEIDPNARDRYIDRRSGALYTHGLEKGDNQSLEEAVSIRRNLLVRRAKEHTPRDWAKTQNNLGNALLTLGERESGTARLEEAVAAYRAALEELTRERVPLDWATTQNNLGTALQRLGERESGTARLEEAVATYRAALRMYERAGASHYVGVVRRNLQRAEQLVNDRRGD